jgi:peptidoglycan/LPS O-acetylase OafA/YrhL
MLPHLVSGFFYVHVFYFGYSNPINPVTWSLETEAQFYIFLPLMVLFISRWTSKFGGIVLFLIFMGISIFLRGFTLSRGLSHLGSSILVYFVNFGTGIIFGFIYFKYREFFVKQKKILFDLITILAVIGIFYFYKPQKIWLNNFLFNISVFTLFLGVFKGTISNWFFTRSIIYLIGGMCYSIYLLHYALFHILVKFSSDIETGFGYWSNFGIQFLILFPIVLLISSVFYITIEKPCMDKRWPYTLYKFLKSKISS